MKRILLFWCAAVLLCCCGRQDDSGKFSYHGLSLRLTTDAFVDSMVARGFAVDSSASDSGRTIVMASEAVPYRVLAGIRNQQLLVVQETYRLSTNDSTRRLWQQLRDGLEKELGAWPDCPILKDDHKVANFDAAEGIISVVLENTYKPTLTVRYVPKQGPETHTPQR